MTNETKKIEEIRKTIDEWDFRLFFKAFLLEQQFSGSNEMLNEIFEVYMDNDYFQYLIDPEILDIDPKEYWIAKGVDEKELEYLDEI
ncbi:hypothetical protein ACEE94_11905 [Staphylococcus epidermidis]